MINDDLVEGAGEGLSYPAELTFGDDEWRRDLQGDAAQQPRNDPAVPHGADQSLPDRRVRAAIVVSDLDGCQQAGARPHGADTRMTAERRNGRREHRLKRGNAL